MTQPDAPQVDDFDDQGQSDTDAQRPEGSDPQSEIAKWKSLARKHETAAKQNAQAARRLAAIEDRDKTDQQRLIEERDAIRAERDQMRAEATRSRLALRYKLDEGDLDFIGSGTDAEMEDRAKRYAERLSGRRPSGDVDQGPRESSSPVGMNDLIRRQARR